MVEKSSTGDKIFNVVDYTLVGIVALLCLYPMLHVLFASISNPIQLMQHSGVLLWPRGFSMEGYKIVVQNPNIPIGYGNTIFMWLLELQSICCFHVWAHMHYRGKITCLKNQLPLALFLPCILAAG